MSLTIKAKLSIHCDSDVMSTPNPIPVILYSKLSFKKCMACFVQFKPLNGDSFVEEILGARHTMTCLASKQASFS